MRLLSLLFYFFLGYFSYSQNEILKFNNQPFETTRKALAQSSKLIFVTATADWCQPCHLMEQSVFADHRVGSFFNTHFYNLKIDIEKIEGSVFALQYEVDTLPALLFLTADGTVVSRSSGYKSAQQLVSLGQQVLNPNLLDQALKARYESGDRKPDFILNYLKRIDPYQKIAVITDYIETKKSWSDLHTIQILFKLPDSILVSHLPSLTANKNEIEKLIGDKLYDDKIKNLIDQKLYCNHEGITLMEAEKIINSAKLKDAKQIFANYKYYYYKVINNDIGQYVKSLINAWELSKNALPVEVFNEQLNELIEYHIKTDIYKVVHKIVKKNRSLFVSPETNSLMARFATNQGYTAKQKYWSKRAERLS